ncbi:acetolactate synthase [Pseudonocardia sp. EC080610-09]|uniref:thiamine pyrophosphate-binding protein n=1 Tax=unclassified Pseudonocardia TaxID=2619320 RepID=UPI0006CB36C8|nr:MULTISPECIES: thiamine pyrophosphate-binding protein [unclassified Pseudonocardia]ALE73788.1 acetolactate synthase [Pseudonocardia sp. EC080625-04]ALL77180.1 acetolactate synthase [Pseudonocardia sp. EC080610-09]ALL80094.1 acetolactate synthase [Pseudonocardia sp. EC080619-01]
MSEKMTGGQLVVKMLESLGVRHVFGVVGGQTLAITDAIIDTPGIEMVHTRHENAAAVMADAYGRLTGTPAVAIATTGPGATNLLTGVGGAFRDSSPAIIVTCNNNGENIHKDDAQNADHVKIFEPFTKYSRLVAHASSIKQAMEEAYVVAMTGNPGPVHLDFARDTIENVVDAPPEVPATHPSRTWVGTRPVPAPAAVAEVAERVLAAERPVIWLGNGGNRARAADDVLALADSLNIPVITTFNGMGAVPTGHPLVFGALSRMGTALTSRVLAESDLVLALGNSLNAVSTRRWKTALPPVVQVDVDPTMIGRYYSETTTGVVGDLGAFCTSLVEATTGGAAAARESRAGWVTGLQQAEKDWWELSGSREPETPGTVSPAVVVRALREVTPPESVLIPDAGNPGVWSFLWEMPRPYRYIKPVGFGNMGFALPAAIASVADDPERPVLALIGDGSLGMSLGEIETLARVGGPVCLVVLNDSSYGNIRQEQELHFDGRTIGVDFGQVDFARVAEGMGVPGRRVTTVEELVDAVKSAFASGRPALVDVVLDRAANAWTYEAFLPHRAG